MSDQLALSASMSVLIMAAYVLFGAEAANAPLPSQDSFAPAAPGISVPGLFDERGPLLPISR